MTENGTQVTEGIKFEFRDGECEMKYREAGQPNQSICVIRESSFHEVSHERGVGLKSGQFNRERIFDLAEFHK